MKSRVFAGCLATGVLLLIGATAVNAQMNTGQILGTVKDSQGLAVSGIPVKIANEQTGQNFEAPTNEVGDYQIGRASCRERV